MYQDGVGVRQNNTEAKEWFGKACDNGNQIGCDLYQVHN
jgi:TPR repeat protein